MNIESEDRDRIIEMAWEDRTPFEAIHYQFGLSESDVIRLMRNELRSNSFKLWRKRVNQGISSKHRFLREGSMVRFRSRNQRIISNNRPSKPK